MNQEEQRVNERQREHAPVTWVSGRIGRKSCMLGFCGKTRHLFFIDFGGLHSMVVTGLDIIDDKCEFSKNCMYFTCPLNHTSPETYLSDSGKRKRKGGKPVRVEFGETVLPDDMVRKDGSGGYVVASKGGPLLVFGRTATKEAT